MTIKATLVVEAVHNVSGRPWIFVSGRLSGGPLAKGTVVTIQTPGKTAATAEIRTLELHSRPGITTVAIDNLFADTVTVGSLLTAG